MLQQKFIQIRFKEQTVCGEYNDCLYFTEEEFAKVKQSEIDTQAMARVNNWVTMLQTAPEPIVPTEEDIQKEIDILNIRLEELEMAKEELISIKVK